MESIGALKKDGISMGELVEVPRDVAVCPYCGSGLFFEVNEACEENGYWWPDDVSTHCSDEPPIDDDLQWEAFISSHSLMPYVYLLPVENKVRDWVRDNFFIKD